MVSMDLARPRISAIVFLFFVFSSDLTGRLAGRAALVNARGRNVAPFDEGLENTAKAALPSPQKEANKTSNVENNVDNSVNITENDVRNDDDVDNSVNITENDVNDDDYANDTTFQADDSKAFGFNASTDDDRIDEALNILQNDSADSIDDLASTEDRSLKRQIAFKELNVDAGSTAFLDCSTAGSAGIQWRRLKEDENVERAEEEEEEEERAKEEAEDEEERAKEEAVGEEITESMSEKYSFKESTLVIREVSLEEAGTYMCMSDSSSIVFKLEIYDEPRIVLKPTNRVIKKPGESVTLECHATGKPEPKIVWAKVGSRLSDEVVNGNRIVFDSVSRHDAGRYMCMATNAIADKRKGLSLVVGDIPGDIVFLSPSVASGATSYKLHFKAQSDAKLDRGRLRLRQVSSGGETLSEETVMFTPKNQRENDDDVKDDDDAQKIPSRREKVTLRNLKPSSKYEVRLQVKSLFGPSKVSSPFFFFTSDSDFFVRASTPTPAYILPGYPIGLGCDYAGSEPEAEFGDRVLVESVLWYFRPDERVGVMRNQHQHPDAVDGSVEIGEGLGDQPADAEEEEEEEEEEADEEIGEESIHKDGISKGEDEAKGDNYTGGAFSNENFSEEDNDEEKEEKVEEEDEVVEEEEETADEDNVEENVEENVEDNAETDTEEGDEEVEEVKANGGGGGVGVDETIETHQNVTGGTERRAKRVIKVTGGSYKFKKFRVKAENDKKDGASKAKTKKLKKWKKKVKNTVDKNQLPKRDDDDEDNFVEAGEAESLATPLPGKRFIIAMRSRFPLNGGQTREDVFSTIWRDRIHFRENFRPKCHERDSSSSSSSSSSIKSACSTAHQWLGKGGLVVDDFQEQHLGGSFECEVDLRFLAPGPQMKRDAAIIRVVDAQKAPFMNPQVSGYDGEWMFTGSLVSLHCRIAEGADLPMRLEWRRNGVLVPSAYTWTNASRSLAYSFAIDATDSNAIYSCHVTHPVFGEKEANLTDIKVFRPMGPLRVSSIDLSTGISASWIPVGAAAELSCGLKDAGSPPASLAWRRESTGTLLASSSSSSPSSSSSFSSSPDDDEEQGVKLSVNITMDKRQSFNTFVCEAKQTVDVKEKDETNKGGSIWPTPPSANNFVNWYVSLDVAFGPSSDGVTIEGDANVTVGANVTLECFVGEVAPEANVSWRKNGNILDQDLSKVVPTENEGNRYILEFQAQESDNGAVFVCTATNSVTGVSASSPSHSLNVFYDFRVFTDSAVVTATIPDDHNSERQDVILHCGAELPADEHMAKHLLTHTLSWYKIPAAHLASRRREEQDAAAGGVDGAATAGAGLKKDLQLQVPDFHNAEDIAFYVGNEEAMEKKTRRRKRMRRMPRAGVKTKDKDPEEREGVLNTRISRRNKRHLGSFFPLVSFSSRSAASSSSSSSAVSNVFRRYLGHHHHFGGVGGGGGGGGGSGEMTRDSLILSYSKYPTLDFEKLDVRKDRAKFGLGSDDASLTIGGVSDSDFGIYVCQVDLHYIPIPPAPQNLHKAVAVELRRKIQA